MLEGSPPSDFRCSRAEQADFLQHRAQAEQEAGFSVTYLAHAKGFVVGFMTLAMDAIALQTKEKPQSDIKLVRFPAVKLAQLAVDERWERQGIGKNMIALAVVLALRLGEQIGCRYLTVDAKADVLDWYRSQEFKENKISRKENEERAGRLGIAAEELPKSLRLDLHSTKADLRDRYPSDFPTDGGSGFP